MSNVKQRILAAGEKAVEELIKVLEDPILGNAMIKEGTGKSSEVSADKMKQAAAAKRLAFDDALYMHDKIEAERKKSGEIHDEPTIKKDIPKSFAEGRAKQSGRKSTA
jgi:hypothetical protein